MNVKIQSVKFDADKKLIDFIESKVAKIAVFAEIARIHYVDIEYGEWINKKLDKTELLTTR